MALRFTAATQQAQFTALGGAGPGGQRRVVACCRCVINDLAHAGSSGFGYLCNFGTTAGSTFGLALVYVSDSATTGHLRVFRKSLGAWVQTDQPADTITSSHVGQEIWVGYRDDGFNVGTGELWVRMPGDSVAVSVANAVAEGTPNDFAALDGTIEIGQRTDGLRQLLGDAGDVLLFDAGPRSAGVLGGSNAMMQALSQGVTADQLTAGQLNGAALVSDIPLIGGQGYDRARPTATMTLTGTPPPAARWMRHAPHAADWPDGYPDAVKAKTRLLYTGLDKSWRVHPPALSGFPTQTCYEVRDRSGNSYHGANQAQPVASTAGTRPHADAEGLHLDSITAPIVSQVVKQLVFNDSSGLSSVPAGNQLPTVACGLGVVYSARTLYAGNNHQLVLITGTGSTGISAAANTSSTGANSGLLRIQAHGAGPTIATPNKPMSVGWDALLLTIPASSSTATLRTPHGPVTATALSGTTTKGVLSLIDVLGIPDVTSVSYAAVVVTDALTSDEADSLHAWMRSLKLIPATWNGAIVHVGSSTARAVNAEATAGVLRRMSRAGRALKIGVGHGSTRTAVQRVQINAGFTGAFPAGEVLTESVSGATCVVRYFNPTTRMLYVSDHTPYATLTAGRTLTGATSSGTMGSVFHFLLSATADAMFSARYLTAVSELLKPANNRLPPGPVAVVIAALGDYLPEAASSLGASGADAVELARLWRAAIEALAPRPGTRWYLQEGHGVTAAGSDFAAYTAAARAAVAAGQFDGTIRIGDDPDLNSAAAAAVTPVYSGDGTHWRTGYVDAAGWFDAELGPVFDSSWASRMDRFGRGRLVR